MYYIRLFVAFLKMKEAYGVNELQPSDASMRA